MYFYFQLPAPVLGTNLCVTMESVSQSDGSATVLMIVATNLTSTQKHAVSVYVFSKVKMWNFIQLRRSTSQQQPVENNYFVNAVERQLIVASPIVVIFSVQKTCPEDQFLCGNGSMCIPKMWLCDEQKDCPNNADEADCSKSLDCKKSLFGTCKSSVYFKLICIVVIMLWFRLQNK